MKNYITNELYIKLVWRFHSKSSNSSLISLNISSIQIICNEGLCIKTLPNKASKSSVLKILCVKIVTKISRFSYL